MNRPVVHVKTVLTDRILISRESARLLEQDIRAAIMANPHSEAVVIDFEGIAGVAPSFLDELLSTIESVIQSQCNGCRSELIVANPPMRISLKFEAVARGHGMSVQPLADGSWSLRAAG